MRSSADCCSGSCAVVRRLVPEIDLALPGVASVMKEAYSDRARDQDTAWAEYVSGLSGAHLTPFEEQWKRYLELYEERSETDGPPLAWTPSSDEIESSNLSALMKRVGCSTFGELHRWSVTERARFWEEIIAWLGIVFDTPPTQVLSPGERPSEERWLVGAQMNCVDSCFRASEDSIAIVSASEDSPGLMKMTYGQLEEAVNRFAGGLVGMGLESGDRIALYMPMTPECVVAYLGAIRAGCQVVSIADSFSPAEVRRRIEIAGAQAIVTATGYRRGRKWIALYEKILEAAAPRAIVIDNPGGGPCGLRKGDRAWKDVLESRPLRLRAVTSPDTPINILFSSGTTGDPKAIPWTHLTPIKVAMDGAFHQDIRARDVVAWPTNIGWMMGPWLIFAALINRATIALYEGSPISSRFTDFVADSGVTILGVVPSLVRAWRSQETVPPGLWRNVRVFSSTGEPSQRQDYLWLMSRAAYRAPVIEYCGGTEVGGGYISGSVVQPASPATFTTPALGLDFHIFDPDDFRQRPDGSGVVFIEGPSIGLSQSLLNRDHWVEYHEGCPKGPRGELLRRHGDEIAVLPKGFFRAHGRADDTMNLGGIKVSSLEIERVANEHDLVSECAAVGLQRGGEGAEELVLVVVPSSKVDDALQLQRDLSDLIAQRLNPLFVISEIVISSELPRTASNKVMRRSLRARLSSQRTAS